MRSWVHGPMYSMMRRPGIYPAYMEQGGRICLRENIGWKTWAGFQLVLPFPKRRRFGRAYLVEYPIIWVYFRRPPGL